MLYYIWTNKHSLVNDCRSMGERSLKFENLEHIGVVSMQQVQKETNN